MAPAVATPAAVLLETLHFAGGLRSTLHGADARPAWVPAFERVGLHNDVYPAPGQFIADLSRFACAPGAGGEASATWYGVYGHAEDLYGDRGVFCAVGLWVAGAALVDSESIYDMLLSLAGLLQRTRGRDGKPGGEFDAACERALRLLSRPPAWIGDAGVAMGGTRDGAGARPVYVALDTALLPGSRVPADLAAAADTLRLAAPSTLPARVLFVPPQGVAYDPRVPPERVLASVERLFDAPPRRFLLRHLLDGHADLAARLERARQARREADRLADAARAEATRATTRAAELAQRLERAEAATATLPAMEVGAFMRALGDLLDARGPAAATSREVDAAAPPMVTTLAALSREVQALRLALDGGIAGEPTRPATASVHGRLRRHHDDDGRPPRTGLVAVAAAAAAACLAGGAAYLLLR